MSLKNALQGLDDQVQQMNAVLSELQITVAVDRPDALAMAEDFAQTLDDLRIALDESSNQLSRLARIDRPQEQIADVWQALLFCQQQIDQTSTELCALNSMDRLAPLKRHALHQGGEWLAWLRIVKDGLARCVQQQHSLCAAHRLCMQEMAERDATGLVTINNRTIGQVSLAE